MASGTFLHNYLLNWRREVTIIGRYSVRITRVRQALARALKEDRGAILIEYALLIGGISIALIAAIASLYVAVQMSFESSVNRIFPGS